MKQETQQQTASTTTSQKVVSQQAQKSSASAIDKLKEFGGFAFLDTYHPIFISGRNDTEQSSAYRIDCSSARAANGSDILRCLRLGEMVEITP